MATHTIQHQPYDLLLNHKPLTALRLNDRNHHNIQIGDYVHIDGHNDIMDRQRFKVVGRIDHANIHDAMGAIEHANISLRDKLSMEHAFTGHHGMESHTHPVTELHLQPQHGPDMGHPGTVPGARPRL
jgi:hypothetical protein